MSRRGSAKPTGIQLFPFLAVLICTMGALVVLLHAFARHGQEQAEKLAEAKQREQSEQEDLDADFFHWRSEHLRESRSKTQADLDAERLKLAHVEDHQRRLEEKLAQLKIAVEELQKAGEGNSSVREQNEAELAKVQAELARTKTALDEARKKGKLEAVNYSVVPFEGRNATHRRPIYIECCENKIIIQPEGIELQPADFIGYFGPGNPLAAALRAQREYFARQSPDGTLDEEPYPLLIVRPEGIAAYYAARSALDSWGNDFGYELIGADWNLSFPPSDPQLKEVVAQVVQESRQRLVEYIASSPQFQRRRSRPVYHVKSHGGISQDGSTGDGPRGSFLGEWDDPENWKRGGVGGPRGTGGAFAGNGDSGAGYEELGKSYGGLGNSEIGDYAPDGVGGGDPYSEPGSIGPQMAGERGGRPMTGGPGGGTLSGSQFADMQRGTAASQDAPGIGPGGAKAADGASGGKGPSRLVEGPAGGGGVPQTRIGPATVGGGPSHAQTPTGSPQGARSQASGQPDGQSANNYHLMAGKGQAASGGAPDSAQFARDASKVDQSQMVPPADASQGSPDGNSMQPPSNPQQLHSGKRQKAATQSIAATRGRGWGVNSQVGAIGASRPVLVRCYGDKLVIVPESRMQAPQEIALGPATEAAIDDLVSGIWNQTESWGKAGRGLYWKPTLVVEVLPGGEERFHDLQLLLTDSGLDVQQRGVKPGTQQAVGPINAR